jgi:CubicO group peptidase (beta-lactamase class C family)
MLRGGPTPARSLIRFAAGLALVIASATAAHAGGAGRSALLGPEGGDRFARVDSIIAAAIRNGATPGAALAIGRRDGEVHVRTFGRIDWAEGAPGVTDSTLYDLASLTKVVGTTAAAMLLVQQKRLSLDAPVYRYLPAWPKKGTKAKVTIRHLLLHTSGLPAGEDLWWVPGDRWERIKWIASRPLVRRPGQRTVYSDLGMIILGAVVERITGERMDEFLDTRLYQPLGMRDTRFNPLDPRHGSLFDVARIAPTEIDNSVRKTHVHGEVHDLNAAALGGVAGHAGLFSSVRDVAKFAQLMLTGATGKDTPVLRGSIIQRFLATRTTKRALGWELTKGTSTGHYLSGSSFGHTGFTGTSIWVDPKRGYYIVLLTNRVDPTSANTKHLALRRAVAEAVSEAMATPVRRSDD